MWLINKNNGLISQLFKKCVLISRITLFRLLSITLFDRIFETKHTHVWEIVQYGVESCLGLVRQTESDGTENHEQALLFWD